MTYYLRLFALGCILATLIILTGCGEITETPVAQVDAASRGEVSLDVSESHQIDGSGMSSDSALDAGEVSSSGERADGGGNLDVHAETAPVCPPHLTCDTTSKECQALCPTCTTIMDGRCVSDGYCVCR